MNRKSGKHKTMKNGKKAFTYRKFTFQKTIFLPKKQQNYKKILKLLSYLQKLTF